MKKIIKKIGFLIFCMLIFNISNVNASTGATVFIAEPIVLDSYENIEITYNYVEIDEEKSEIKNTQIFTNTSNELITKKATIKLEDSYNKLTINSLKILVNNFEINEISKDEEDYIFYFQINPNESKKIEITYKTDSNLTDSKILKYSMDKIKGKNVKLFKINVKLNKYDIPLVEKIWPGAYEFNDNIVETEYVDFMVNNLTSTFIIQKDTYKNIKYGDYANSYSDEEMYIINNAKDIIDNGFEIFYNTEAYAKDSIDEVKTFKKLTNSVNTYNYFPLNDNPTASIYYYAQALQLEKTGKQYYFDEEGNKKTNLMYSASNIMGYCLSCQTISKICKDANLYSSTDEYFNNPVLYGKMVAINYFETEGDNQLYVKKNIDNEMESGNYGYVKRSEYDILRTINKSRWHTGPSYRGYKAVYVNSDIDGNKIDITEKEIIDFVNMKNIDLYITLLIYDTSDKESSAKAGCYTNNMEEIVKEYINIDGRIKKTKDSIQTITKNYESGDSRFSYEWYINLKEEYEEAIKKIENSYIKFDEEVIENNVKVPTVAQCVGIRNYEDGKYIIRYITPDFQDSLGHIYKALECDTSKKLLSDNEKYNYSKKNAILSKINNSKITQDSEEYRESKKEISKASIQEEKNEETKNSIIKIIQKNYILIVIIFTILILIIIIIIMLLIKPNRRKR